MPTLLFLLGFVLLVAAGVWLLSWAADTHRAKKQPDPDEDRFDGLGW